MQRFLTILTAFLLSSSLAQAVCGIGGSSGGSHVTWEQILKCEFLVVDFPSLEIGNQRVHYNELCLDSGKVRTIRPLPVQSGDFQDDPFIYIRNWDDLYYGKEMSMEYLFVDPGLPREECLHWHGKECDSWRTIDHDIPLATPVKVYRIGNAQEMELFFVKDFNLSVCK
jgi:hypothetical protein